jgi:hypothetical protein
MGTVNFAYTGANGLGWNATGGERKYAVHIDCKHWGWNARGASRRFLAYEFAQPTAAYDIVNEQVDAFCAWYRDDVLTAWPGFRLTASNFPMHSELQEGIFDGKSDAFPRFDPRIAELRARILEKL